MTTKKKTITVPDGKQAIFLPASARGVVCLVLGDSDQDGKLGLKPLVFADLPDALDRNPGLEPVEFLNKAIPEFDSIGEFDLPKAFDNVAMAIKPILTMIAKLVRVFRK